MSGQTNGVTHVKNGASPNVLIDGGAGSFTVIGDVDPIGDICSSSKRIQVTMGGRNIGDLLNAANVSWGWFEEGFDVKAVNPDGSTGCKRSHTSAVTGLASNDYIAHHEPFQYYPSTANLAHVRPTSVATIGKKGDAANHQYDLADFFAAADAGHFPAVAFLKPAAYQNGHAGYSDPIDEQAFLVRVLNDLQQRPEWKSTAVFLTWDDSGRLVRPPDGADRQFLGRSDRRARRRRDLRRREGHPARHLTGESPRAGPVRVRAAPAAAGDFAVGEEQLRGFDRHGRDVDHRASSKTSFSTAGASAADRSTRSPARSITCSTSRGRRT